MEEEKVETSERRDGRREREHKKEMETPEGIDRAGKRDGPKKGTARNRLCLLDFPLSASHYFFLGSGNQIGAEDK